MPRAADPILLLHGQPGAARDWDRVRAAIGERAPTIAINRPGWDGRSCAEGLQGNARAALAALGSRDIERATLVGHSLGAAVAAWLAAVHPERVGALVLVAPAANEASLYALDRWLAAPIAGYLASVATLAGLGLALTAGPLRRKIASDQALDDRYLRAAGQRLLTPWAWRSFYIEQQALIRDLPSLESRLDQVSVATTIVSGLKDRIVPLSSARRLARQIPHAELRLLERTGHLIPQQRADELAEIIAPQSPPA